MTYVGILLSIAIMGGIISMAFNKKSNFPTRVASLIALALMVITIIICLVVAITDNTVIVDESVLIVGAPIEAKKPDSNNFMVLFLLIIFLVGFFVVTSVLAIKEYRKLYPKKEDVIDTIGAIDNKESIRDLL
jgi:amino acid transporter